MTFRNRLVLVAAVAVVVAVLAASVSSYFAARNALVGSVDGTLETTAQSIIAHGGRVNEGDLGVQIDLQYVDPQGEVIGGGGSIPVPPSVASVASGQSPSYFSDVTLRGQDYRELVVSAGQVEIITQGIVVATTRAALQIVLPLTAVDGQLSHLGTILILIAVLGIALALLLAWLVGRTALVPLDELTLAVEEIATTTDVSQRLEPGGADELGRLRRAFNHLLSALERSREAQRQLVLDAGHELRTPLTSIRTNLEVVRRLDELPPEEREVLIDDLLAQMGELTALVGDLSELARGEHRQSVPAPFRLDELVEDAVSVAQAHGRTRGVTFQVDSSPNWVVGQRDRIARAVGNLLDNALKWSPDQSVVEVACRHGSVIVHDHGPGIDPDDLPHIFDRFYRSPAARSRPGSGLGLAIVAQVANAEGGSIEGGNAEDGGAMFRLSFPVVPFPAPVAPPDTPADPPPDSPADPPPGTPADPPPDSR
ncbi:MAG: HAMP domain-containing sensor histidine kinase [Actinomycetota bacterium]|nr:HAMP domain-containing sensor histidine kinase [Actinomycetota bacterium]